MFQSTVNLRSLKKNLSKTQLDYTKCFRFILKGLPKNKTLFYWSILLWKLLECFNLNGDSTCKTTITWQARSCCINCRYVQSIFVTMFSIWHLWMLFSYKCHHSVKIWHHNCHQRLEHLLPVLLHDISGRWFTAFQNIVSVILEIKGNKMLTALFMVFMVSTLR